MRGRRISASFYQILADAKLNRSVQETSPNELPPPHESPAIVVGPTNCPPAKKARAFNNSIASPRSVSKSVAIPTAFQKTPQAKVSKCQQQKKPPNALQVLSSSRNTHQVHDTSKLSTPTRRIKETPTLRQNTPQLSSLPRRIVPTSVLRAINTPSIQLFEQDGDVKLDPMHGPVQLKSIVDLKWAQELGAVPEGPYEVRVPVWNPLSEDYFDHQGPTAGCEKGSVSRKVGKGKLLMRLVSKLYTSEVALVQLINQCGGDICLIRKRVVDLDVLRTHDNQSAEFRAYVDRLMEFYSHNAGFYSELMRKEFDRRHVENEQFIAYIKSQIKSVMDDWIAA